MLMIKDIEASRRASGTLYYRRLLLSCIILLPACGAAEAPDRQTSREVQSNVASRFAVAGISPGMTSAQVAVAAARAGYRLVNTSSGPDWASAQKRAVEGFRLDVGSISRGVQDHEFRRGGELLRVTYLPLPKGSVATLVSYLAPPGILDFASADAELGRRYGKKSFGNQAGAPWSMWCPRRASSARDCLNYARLTLSKTNNGVSMDAEDPAIKLEQQRLLSSASGRKASF